MSKTPRAAASPHGAEADENVRVVVRMLLAAKRQKPVELALRLGISKSAIYSRLGGQSAFSIAELVTMAEHFDVPPSVFLVGPSALIGAARGSTIGQYRTPTPGVSAPVATPYPRLRAVA